MSVCACPLPVVVSKSVATAKVAQVASAHPQLSAAAQSRWAARELGIDVPTLNSALAGKSATQPLSSAAPDVSGDNQRQRSTAAAINPDTWSPESGHSVYAVDINRRVREIDQPRLGDPLFKGSTPTKDPTTLKGYRKMFNAVDTNLWGGGDVSISHELPDGRRVWLYGDTWSAKNGFVHSTILVQKNGVLTPANKGKQILPNGGPDPSDPSRQIIYWFDGVKQGPTPDTIIVTAMEMSIGSGGPWDFRKTRDGQSRQAVLKVNKDGTVTFKGWKGYVDTPVKGNPHLANDFKDLGGGHYTYGTVVHDIKLADGSYLTTTSQNYTDPLENHIGPDGFQWWDYRPILGSTKRKP